MGCCRKNRKLQPSPLSKKSIDAPSPIIYVLCRHCGLMKTMRFNLAANYVKLECETCKQKTFHVMKTLPKPEELKKLIIKE